MKSQKPEVGQIVFCVDREFATIKGRISAVGRKYIEIKGIGKFSISDGIKHVENYSRYERVFFSLEEINIEKEKNMLHKLLRDTFFYQYRPVLSLDQMRRIVDILKEVE
jgi:hypothetical protein